VRTIWLAALTCAVATAVAAGNGSRGRERYPAPPGVVSVQSGADELGFWPYTSHDFSGSPLDPMNLVFVGDADPRQIRQALLDLDGYRVPYGFPNAAPFDCTWSDAIGAPSTAYGEGEGWTGSAIGLQCGEYAQLRVHLRLFRQGEFTLGGAHFEVLIPGTTEHEVLSWILPREIVTVDLMRAGALLVDPVLTEPITPAPTYRAIRPEVYGFLPDELKVGLGLPPGPAAGPVPIPSDGRVRLLHVVQTFEPESSDVRVVFDHPFGQFVPRPFCGDDIIRIDGALRFDYRVKTNPSGAYRARFKATGTLSVTPIDTSTGQRSGPTVPAVVSETHRFWLTDRRQQAILDRQQSILEDPGQYLLERLAAGHRDRYEVSLDCGSQP